MHEITIYFTDFFSELRSNFSAGNILEQLRVDIHRLFILFYTDYIPSVDRKIKRVKDLDQLIFMLYRLDNYYNTKLYFISYFCNQCVFHQIYKHVLSVTSSEYPDSYLLDSEISEKTIKIHFSINSIFFSVFGKFELVYIDDENFEKQHIRFISYNLSFFLEYDRILRKLIVPENVYIHYLYI